MIKEAYYMLNGKQIGNLPFPENARIARRVAAEGMVLLKNDGTLPLRGKKLALFGYGLSYTTFDMAPVAVTADWNRVCVTVSVRNIPKPWAFPRLQCAMVLQVSI